MHRQQQNSIRQCERCCIVSCEYLQRNRPHKIARTCEYCFKGVSHRAWHTIKNTWSRIFASSINPSSYSLNNCSTNICGVAELLSSSLLFVFLASSCSTKSFLAFFCASITYTCEGKQNYACKSRKKFEREKNLTCFGRLSAASRYLRSCLYNLVFV